METDPEVMDAEAAGAKPRKGKGVKGAGTLSAAIAVLLIISGAGVYSWLAGDDDDDRDVIVEIVGDRQVTTSPENTNEITVIVNPANPDNIVMGANDYSTPHNDVWCGYYTSMDGGETWSTGFIPGHPTDFSQEGAISPLKVFTTTGDPVLAVASDGTMYYAGIGFERSFAGPSAIFVAKSTDGGLTWPSADIRIISYWGDGVTSFHDKEWIAVDPNSGNVYCAWAMFSLLSASNIMFTRSTDEGNTWSVPQPISEFYNTDYSNQGTAITVDNTGKIHVIWIDFDSPISGKNELVYVHSDDQGRTFTDPVPIAEVEPIPYSHPNGTYRTPTLPALAVDISGGGSDGYLYAVWNDQSLGDPDAMLIYSHDGGRSWSEPVRVNDDEKGNGAWQFFPTVQADDRGLVHMIFYDTRDDPGRTRLNVYYAVSDDHGRSWKNYILSEESCDGNAGGGSWRGEITSGDAFIGDYIDIDTGGGYAYGGWCDTRNGEPDDRNSDCYAGIVHYGFD